MKSNFTRRQFLQRSAGFAGAAAITPKLLTNPNPIPPRGTYVPPSDRVPSASSGSGMRGPPSLPSAFSPPGVKSAAPSDFWDGRHQPAKEITAKPDLFVTRKYHELLDRKDIDCIVAAVPDHWH